MTIDQDTVVFFDASCLIAAAGSTSGGSGFLLSLCARGLLQGAVSPALRQPGVRLDNLALVPASLLPFKDQGRPQPIACSRGRGAYNPAYDQHPFKEDP